MSIDLDAIRTRLARVVGKWPTTGVLAPGADEFGPKAWSAHGPLRCHATERGRARQWTQACADADFIAAAPTDIAALLDEVERLRKHRELCTENLLRGYETGKAEERAAVVAYLRAALRLHYADRIERGEHRREEDK